MTLDNSGIKAALLAAILVRTFNDNVNVPCKNYNYSTWFLIFAYLFCILLVINRSFGFNLHRGSIF